MPFSESNILRLRRASGELLEPKDMSTYTLRSDLLVRASVRTIAQWFNRQSLA